MKDDEVTAGEARAMQREIDRLSAQVDILAARSAAAEASLMTARAEIANLEARLRRYEGQSAAGMLDRS